MEEKNRLEENIERYSELTQDIITFRENIKTISELALDIFLDIAKISNLEIQPVYIQMQKVLEQAGTILKEATATPSVPEIGEIKFSNTKGSIVFVDFTKSTSYFKEKENYTGFVIFNAYILLVKTITRLTGGEFLEHTGDGAMIFYRNRNIIEDFLKQFRQNNICYFFKTSNPLCLYFSSGEYLKNYAFQNQLIDFDIIISKGYFKEPSLIHIGADYGELLEINLGDIKKLFSKTVWNAANRCKNASRTVRYFFDKENNIIYLLDPIKVDDRLEE